MDKLNNIHPGEILQAEFLVPFKRTAYSPDTDFANNKRKT